MGYIVVNIVVFVVEIKDLGNLFLVVLWDEKGLQIPDYLGADYKSAPAKGH